MDARLAKIMPGRNARFAGKEPLGQETLKAVRWGKRFFDTLYPCSSFLLKERERKRERARRMTRTRSRADPSRDD